MKKQAGLFMRPSDVAGDHRDLSAALEQQLNGSPGQKGHFKQAGVSRKTSVAAGAVIGGTRRLLDVRRLSLWSHRP